MFVILFLETQPTVKYERIMYDVHRPVAPTLPPASPMDVDPESPLDMTVRRKDSDRQPATPPVDQPQNSPTGSGSSGNESRDAPINFNMRPSVITKAPPQPIKKRISSMHSNGRETSNFKSI